MLSHIIQLLATNIYSVSCLMSSGWDDIVGTAYHHGMNGSGFEPLWKKETFCSLRPTILAVGFAQPVELVSGLFNL